MVDDHAVLQIVDKSETRAKALEALRRVSVHAWHRGFAIPEAELDRFLNAGFSEQQFEAVISRIQRSKAQASCCKNGPQPGHVHALA